MNLSHMRLVVIADFRDICRSILMYFDFDSPINYNTIISLFLIFMIKLKKN